MDIIDGESHEEIYEKNEYLFRRLALGYAKVFTFRSSFCGKMVGFLERLVRYCTFRPNSKSELSLAYEASKEFMLKHGLDYRALLVEEAKKNSFE